MIRSTRFRATVALTAALALSLSACSDDDSSDDQSEEMSDDAMSEEMSDDAMSEEMSDDAMSEEAMGETITVTTVDYAFEGLPGELAAGTTLGIENASEAEAHEILAILLPEDETRSAEELAALPEEELMPLLANLRGVALAAPGGENIVPDPLVLAEPGRYFFFCSLPTGAAPDDILQAVADYFEAGAPADSAPEYPETGPPHFVNGMYAEAVVS